LEIWDLGFGIFGFLDGKGGREAAIIIAAHFFMFFVLYRTI
jgi:hypothetical protein